jgi:hypothetical protein
MKCFVIMPFAEEFTPVYDQIRLAVETAIYNEPVTCFRLDDIVAAGRITERLVRELADAVICIADVTNTNPNVMWEVGYAMALGKPILLISQDRQGLPFDLKDMQTVFYQKDKLEVSLRKPLGEAFRATLREYGVRASSHPGSPIAQGELVLAITGSKQARELRVIHQMESLLRPHFERNAKWLVGSWGITDETAISMLVERNQRVIVVGNDEFDISPAALKLIEKHNLQFLSAADQHFPRRIPGRPREVFFLLRADLVFLLWSGKSNRVKEMMRWYRDNGKDHVIGFI